MRPSHLPNLRRRSGEGSCHSWFPRARCEAQDFPLATPPQPAGRRPYARTGAYDRRCIHWWPQCSARPGCQRRRPLAARPPDRPQHSWRQPGAGMPPVRPGHSAQRRRRCLFHRHPLGSPKGGLVWRTPSSVQQRWASVTALFAPPGAERSMASFPTLGDSRPPHRQRHGFKLARTPWRPRCQLC